jgi:hypothetical protein
MRIAFHDQQRSPDAFLFAAIESPDDSSRCVLDGDPERGSQHRSRGSARDKSHSGPDEGSGQVRTSTLQLSAQITVLALVVHPRSIEYLIGALASSLASS